jgi:small conductance mechanosensitive channel
MDIQNILQNVLLPWLKTDGLEVALVVIAVLVIRKFGKVVVEKIVRKSVPADAFMRPEDEEARENTLIQILNGIISVLIWVVAVMMILSSLGVNIAPLLAGAGLLGVAVGFGAQYLVRDIITGLFIILENQYRVGDVISLDGTSGTVERVTLRTTILRDMDGVVHHVPNGEIKITSNKSRDWARVNLVIGVGYNEDLDKVERVVNKTGEDLANDPAWSDKIVEAPVFLRVDKLNDSSVDVRILGKTMPNDQWAVTGELRKRIKIAFDKEKIEIPYPHRVVYTQK